MVASRNLALFRQGVTMEIRGGFCKVRGVLLYQWGTFRGLGG
jgi:hypothetical protein